MVANAGNVLTENLSEPLNDVTTAKIDVDTGTGNLTIDRLTGGEQLLAGGTLQYFENLGQPTRTLVSFLGQATLTLKWGDNGSPCAGPIEWQIHLNPTVSSDITAHSGGGNVKLDLTDMAVTHVSADTGGGNVDVVLPDDASGLNVQASTGAGNVVVLVPSGIAAKIHATSGLGKVIVDSQFSQIDGNIYQSPDYDSAANKIEIIVSSGAGNVVVNTK
jgi:predicted membrane protein